MFFAAFFTTSLFSKECDYSHCRSLQDVINKETQEINITNQSNNQELAELYVSRGESYLLNNQYDKALEDFQNSNFHMGYCHDLNEIKIIAFRIAFGEAVSYDNLGMTKQAQDSIEHLKAIVMHIGCDDCIDHHPYQGMLAQSANEKPLKGLVSYAINQANNYQGAIIVRIKKTNLLKNQKIIKAIIMTS